MLPLHALTAQIAVIIVTARVVGWMFRKLHQPAVIGEMVAGVLLGPSLLGRLAPQFSAMLFPPESLPALSALSGIGLLVFMFLVGLELDPETMRGHGHSALLTSHVSIVLPFLLGSGLGLLLYPRLSDASVSFSQFASFLGVAMSVTA